MADGQEVLQYNMICQWCLFNDYERPITQIFKDTPLFNPTNGHVAPFTDYH